MSQSSQLMEITHRTVGIARESAVKSERNRILKGIRELESKQISPETRLLIHEIKMLIRDDN
jgi:hypothetical protein